MPNSFLGEYISYLIDNINFFASSCYLVATAKYRIILVCRNCGDTIFTIFYNLLAFSPLLYLNSVKTFSLDTAPI